MDIRSDLRNCRLYFFGLLLFLLYGLSLVVFNGKAESFISLNSYHPDFLNAFFINYTFIGNGLFSIGIIILLFFHPKGKQLAIALLLSFLISGLCTQVIKNLVSAPRPRLFFETGQYFYFIDGVSLSNYSSFPSGHTATAFAVATTLVLMIKNKNWQLIILIAAALVGYSRIYLAQHFLLDVIVGASIGCVSGVLSVYIARRIKFTRRPVRSFASPSAFQTS
jgi:membrane-associated phospholipid phosphatase